MWNVPEVRYLYGKSLIKVKRVLAVAGQNSTYTRLREVGTWRSKNTINHLNIEILEPWLERNAGNMCECDSLAARCYRTMEIR